jgi:hypothetical protein
LRDAVGIYESSGHLCKSQQALILCRLRQNSVMANSGHLRKSQWTQKLQQTFMPEMLV